MDYNIKYNNKNYYYFIENKLNISSNLFNIFSIENDGNCFYRCLQKYLFDSENKYNILRKAKAQYCKENRNIISNFKKDLEYRYNLYITTVEYINLIGNDKNWANNIDISMRAYFFNINIATYKYSNNNNILEYFHNYSSKDYSNIPLMILIN